MSLITQCPACTTLFKVVPDQLRVSDGWVRCGQCDEVFDANVHMHKGSTTVLPAVSAAESITDTVASAGVEAAATDGEALPLVALAAVSSTEFVAEAESGESDLAPIARETEGGFRDALSPPPQSLEKLPFSASQLHQLDDDAVVDSQFSFMQDSAKTSQKYHPLARGGLVLLVVLLSVLMLGQIVVQERDRIGATEPGAKKLLEPMCSILGCILSPLRQFDAVVIDSSSFVNVHANVYRLSVVLKNTYPLDVAAPALELSLTDRQDRPVIKRVIPAAELPDSRLIMGANAEFNTSFPLEVTLPSGVEPISGYRLLAFYP